MRAFRRDFRTLLTLIVVALAIVPVLVLTYPFTKLVSGVVEKAAARETALIAEGLALNLQAEFRMIVAQSLALSRDSDIQRGTRSTLFSEKAAFLMKRFLNDNPLTGAAFLLDESFRLNAEAAMEPGGLTTSAEAAAALARKSFQGEVPDQTDGQGYYRFIEEERVLLLAIPVQGPLERATGLLLIELPRERVRGFVATKVRPPASAELLETVPPSLAEDPRARAETSTDFTHFAPVTISGPPGNASISMAVQVREPKAVRLEALRGTVRWMVLSSLLLAGISGLIGYYLAFRLNLPFRRLNEHVRRYEAGDYGARSPSFALDEFRTIAGTLDSMAGKILAHIEAATATERARGEVERARLETELHSLHQQMQPHFLFNTLNSIGAMIHIDADRATELVSKFSDLYRMILEMSRTNTVPLKKELTVVSHYLDLQKTRFGERLRYSIECPEDLLELHVPGLMLQTLVENAIKHGVARTREGGEVLVRIAAGTEGRYRCEVVNGGAALGASPGEGHGTGLENTRRRLTLLYGDRHEFTLRTGDPATDPTDAGLEGKTIASFYISGSPL